MPELLQLEDRQLLATFTVTSTLDTVTNNVPANGTLRWAVQQADLAGGSNTISFQQPLFNTAQTITLSQLGSPVEMTTGSPTIAIDGPGASLLTIAVAPLDGVALVVDSGVTATITGLTVTGASLSATNGGAISDDGSLSLSNCTITNNTISGVYVKGSANISDCTITGNNSYSGAGVFVKGGTATITNSTLSNNTGSQGGGVCNEGTATLTNCTLSGDSTLGGGGGLYNSSQLKVYGSMLTGDSGSGAAVYNKSGTAYLSGTTISGGSGFIDGGNLNNQFGATLNVTNCTISGATAQIGAGLYNAGTATLTNCTISNNYATFGYGGGISNGHLQNKAVLIVSDSTIVGNSCKEGGGGVGNWGTATLTDDTIANNFANQGTSLLASDGGGVDNDGTVTLVACTISGNTTTALGGGIYNGGLGKNLATLNDTIVAGNTTSSGAASDIAISSNNGVDVTGSYDLIGIGGTGGIVNTGGDIVLTSLANLGLSPLGNYGGPTETMALLPGSPALGAGSKALEVNAQNQPLTTDQRGEPLDKPNPDIGAFQSQGFTLTAVADSTPQTTGTGQAFANPLAVTLTANDSEEPVTGAVVTFTVDPDSNGASATLSGTSETVGANGVAQVTATANSTKGSYEVTASFAGDTTPVTFNLTNLLSLTFAVPASQSITWGTSSVTLGGSLANGTQAPVGENVSVDFNSDTQTTPIGSQGAFSINFPTTNLAISSSGYPVVYSYTSDGVYASVSTTATLIVTKATPVLSVTDAGGTYNNSPYPATDSVAGLSGTPGPSLEGVTPSLAYYSGTYSSASQLTGLTSSATAPTTAGPYTVLVSFAGSTHYAADSALANFTIAQVLPTLTVADSGGTYTGTTFPATDTLAGLNGTPVSSLEGVTPSLAYYKGTYTSVSQLSGLTHSSSAPSSAGPYTVLASFAGSTDYAAASALANFTIAQVTPTLTVTDFGGTYDDTAFPATDSVAGLNGVAGTKLEGVTPSLAYYSGTYSSASQLNGLTSSSTAPSAAGAYTVLASFAGSTDYSAASALANFTIAQISPSVTVTDSDGTYNGTGFNATATVTGLSGSPAASLEGVTPSLAYYSGTYSSGSQLTGLTSSSTAPSAVGAYTVLASFAGSTDYTAASALANFTITQATPTVNILVAYGPYKGTAFLASPSVAGVGGSSGASLEGVTVSLAYYTGTYTSASQLTGLTSSTTAPSTAGAYTILASFAGSTDYTAASALGNFTITQATPTVSVSDPGGNYSGTPFAATTTVTGVSGSPASSLEGVTPSLAYYTGTYSSAAQLNGLTSSSTAPSAVGAYTVLASFAGSTDYTAASGLANFTIALIKPQITWAQPADITYGTALTATQLDASTTVPGTFAYTPALGAILNAGTDQTLSVSFTPQDPTLYASAVATTKINVDQATPTLNISVAGGSFNGAPIPASFTISSPANSPLQGITLSLIYYSAGISLGSSAPTAPGNYTVVAFFPGNADYAPVQSAAVPFTIAPGNATVSMTSTSTSTASGQSVTFVATVAASAAAAGTPGGMVTFSDFGTPLATVALNSSGTASFSTSNLAVGTHAITATYSGDTDFLGVQSGPTSESVNKASANVVLVPQPTLKKKKVVSVGLEAEFEPISPGSGVPTGAVVFELVTTTKKKSKVTKLGTATLSGGVATLPVKPNKVLNKAITIVYSGDADFQSITVTELKLTQTQLKSMARPMLALMNRDRPHPDVARTIAVRRS